MLRKVDLPEPLRPTSPMCSPSVKAIVAPSSTTWMPYLTERLFALAMTALDVSAMGTSKVERAICLRKVAPKNAPRVKCSLVRHGGGLNDYPPCKKSHHFFGSTLRPKKPLGFIFQSTKTGKFIVRRATRTWKIRLENRAW